MEIIYRAFNGKEFTGIGACEECQAYERRMRDFPLAYDCFGNKTTQVSAATFVVIKDSTELTTFCKECENKNESCIGITDIGEWIWSYEFSQYISADHVIQAIKDYTDNTKE